MSTNRGVSTSCWVGIALAGASCAVGPEYARPASTTNEEWLAADGAQITGDPVDYGAWWEAFADRELDALVGLARAGNLSLQAAAARVVEARAAGRRPRLPPPRRVAWLVDAHVASTTGG